MTGKQRSMSVMKRIGVACGVLLATALGAVEPSAVAEFASKQEAQIASRLEKEKPARRRAQFEVLLRQDYGARLDAEQKRMVRSGKLSTPEVEALRAKRTELIKQLEQLDREIDEASLKAPEILELQAIAKANVARIQEVQESLKGSKQLLPKQAGGGQTEEVGAPSKP